MSKLKLPEDICWFPRKSEFRPDGAPLRFYIIRTSEETVALLNASLEECRERAKSKKQLSPEPFADFGHYVPLGTEPGEGFHGWSFKPNRFFWDPRTGVRVSCRWNPDFYEQILFGLIIGTWRMLSPCLLLKDPTKITSSIIGTGPDIGGIVHRSAVVSQLPINPVRDLTF